MTSSCRAGLRLLALLIVTITATTGCSGDKASHEAKTAVTMAPAMAEPAKADQLQQEQYGHVRENDFLKVAHNPLSTFSADVNTASYSNVRRFLEMGQLPPADAVLLADFVNYFPYSYPPPADGDPVSLTLDIAPCPWNKPHHLVRIGVQAELLKAEHLPPRNLVFLVDSSGSMSGDNRLGLVKRSLGLLIDQLTEKDTVSVVTYAGDARLVLPPTPGNQRERLHGAVNSLSAGGGTNGGGGIQMAYLQARESFRQGGANRVILCTDGDFNLGVTSSGDLVRLIEQQRASGVFLTVLGFGMGNLKNRTMEELAQHGNGHYAYIDGENEARKVFVEQGAALVAVAKDVKFQVEFNPAKVAAYRLIGYENRVMKHEEFKDDGKDAGDMGSGHTVTALYEVVPVGAEADPRPAIDPLKYQKVESKPTPAAGEWLTVKMRYKYPADGKSLELARALPADALGKPMSADFRMAAAAVQFGMLLRNSPHRANANYAAVLTEAQGAIGTDPSGHRAEFVRLVQTAQRLQTKPTVD